MTLRLDVAVVIDSLSGGGTERSMALLLPHLRTHGIDARVYCLWDRGGPEDSLENAGIPVRSLAEGGLVTKLRDLRRALRRQRPDLVHTSLLQADLVGRMAVVGTDIPVLSSAVNTSYVSPLEPRGPRQSLVAAGVRLGDRATAQLADVDFHAVTDGVAEHIMRRLRVPPTRIAVVERGRPPEGLGTRSDTRRTQARTTLDLSTTTQLVLAVGREVHQKGFDVLIEAMSTVVRRFPHAQLCIAGPSGAASTALRDQVDQLGISGNVRFLGPRDDVPELMCAADLLAVSSRYEGTAGVMIEAWALETPIVTTELEGMAGLAHDGVNAVVVPQGSPVGLARGIVQLLDDPALAGRLSSAGRSLFEERFTLDRSAQRMAQLYRGAASRSPRRPPVSWGRVERLSALMDAAAHEEAL